jgi:penicillin amidase|tara:strand:- start:3464 stop:5725 length:2262 start_codon:yes stop_codon:yes gene_type:complete
MRKFKNFKAKRLAVIFTFLATLSTGCESESDNFQELAENHLPQIEGEIIIPGLQSEVEIIRDPWGVPHIYADNIDDLFFAQGFVQAQDRLWQMDMYRRAGEGRLSEIMGPEWLEHDRTARLLKYRGPWTEEEFSSYHPEGHRILTAFSSGINAYIDHAKSSGELPVEFTITGIEPELWTAETPLLRIATAMPTRDGMREISLARSVLDLGPEEANRQARPTPFRELTIPKGLNLSAISQNIADGLRGFRGTIVKPNVIKPFDSWSNRQASVNLGAFENSPGSNNWVISGDLTASGQVILANDPHRGVTNPSLRYMVHLDAPGWTAIGSTEPVLPGVAIGHNGRIGWGLTIVGTDQSDVYQETVNPENTDEVLWNGNWEPVRIEVDTIHISGEEPRLVELKFTRHGPIFFEDQENNLAYSLRSTMHEPGTTGYLPALRLNVANNCSEFLDAMDYWMAPTENMICGDVLGNIAWQASALSPKREGWHGRLPVPGTGEFEWNGFRNDLPREFNPARGWIGTANHDIHPADYDPPLFFKTAPALTPRILRVREVLNSGNTFTVQDSKNLQHDAYSASSAKDLELLRGWVANDPEVEALRQEVESWDGVYGRNSRPAAIFSHMQGFLQEEPIAEDVFMRALSSIRQEQGNNPSEWRWGRINRSEFPHDLISAYDIEPVERLGGAGTVAATGATFREIIDFSDLDASQATISPGQSGRPGSPFYDNLAESWGNQEYFPLSFTREAVEHNGEYTLILKPM